MIEEYCVSLEDEQIPVMDQMDLLEVMDICSNLYLTHLLTMEILGYRNDPFCEFGENASVVSILSFSKQMFFKLSQIH